MGAHYHLPPPRGRVVDAKQRPGGAGKVTRTPPLPPPRGRGGDAKQRPGGEDKATRTPPLPPPRGRGAERSEAGWEGPGDPDTGLSDLALPPPPGLRCASTTLPRGGGRKPLRPHKSVGPHESNGVQMKTGKISDLHPLDPVFSSAIGPAPALAGACRTKLHAAVFIDLIGYCRPPPPPAPHPPPPDPRRRRPPRPPPRRTAR